MAMAAAAGRARKLRRGGAAVAQAAMVVAMVVLGTFVLVWGVSMPPLVVTAPLLQRSNSNRELRDAAMQEEDDAVITMEGMYNEIAFEDVDGGAWKQGWEVRYNGSEWDDRPLNVFVVPHSHNDPGWIRTVEEYYRERTRPILNTVVAALLKDKRRKFIWEEMSYLYRWWQDASQEDKDNLRRLVKSGQLEIVGGGWVMNDEANSHFYAIIEQMYAGNSWLWAELGVTPKNSWAIDPFGHSATMPYLLRGMQFDNMLIQRTHYEVKKVLAMRQSLEFRWRQHWSSGKEDKGRNDMLCHMMPFYSYDIPHTCGPEPAVCCQFDWWRLPFGSASRCPWGKNPQQINADNVAERAATLLDQYKKKSILYRTNTLLVPLGDDFRYVTSTEADLQYTNYEAIFEYVNRNSAKFKARLQFGTLSDYFTALRSEAGRTRHFPALSGDFFTYADRAHDYWSGYFTTRPFYKAVDRVLEHTLRAADIATVLFGGANETVLDMLELARRNLALFQHHDGVTGTARDHVVEDYGQRMHSSLKSLEEIMAATFSHRHGLTNLQPEKTRQGFNLLALSSAVQVSAGGVVVFFNPLAEKVSQVATLVVEADAGGGLPEVCVFDGSGNGVPSQLSPEFGHIGDTSSSTRHRLHFFVTIAGLSSSVYSVKPATSSCGASVRATVSVSRNAACPAGYDCNFSNESAISVGHLVFDGSTGLLRKWRDTAVEEDVLAYRSAGSGAYLFLPSGEARSLLTEDVAARVTVVRGRMMEEVRFSLPSGPLARSARLYLEAEEAEFVYHVELLERRFNDMEVVARFRTGVQSGDTFYSDANGFQMIKRRTYSKIPLQGNFYPMPSLAFVADEEGRRFSVHSRQAVGVASLQEGWLEMMLDRRLTQDDGRGLAQGILDNRPLDVTFHILLERNWQQMQQQEQQQRLREEAQKQEQQRVREELQKQEQQQQQQDQDQQELNQQENEELWRREQLQQQKLRQDGGAFPTLLSHRVSSRLNYPLQAFLAAGSTDGSAVGTDGSADRGLLKLLLPCDVHLVSLRPLKGGQSGLLLQRWGWDASFGDSCSISSSSNGVFSSSFSGSNGLNRNSGMVDVRGMFSSSGRVVKQVTLCSLNFVGAGGDEDGLLLLEGRKTKLGSSSSRSKVDLPAMELRAYKVRL